MSQAREIGELVSLRKFEVNFWGKELRRDLRYKLMIQSMGIIMKDIHFSVCDESLTVSNVYARGIAT